VSRRGLALDGVRPDGDLRPTKANVARDLSWITPAAPPAGNTTH
jgi:hypothetical protein